MNSSDGKLIPATPHELRDGRTQGGLSLGILLERVPIRAREQVPNKLLFTDEEAELDFYARTAFTALDYALARKCYHPKLWNAVRGTVYETAYCRFFGRPK
jgi:hypothetical protein